MDVNLSQFTSLFEIGFALHFAVALIDRIYARELPIRIERITARTNAIELFKQEIIDRRRWCEEQNTKNELRLAYHTIDNPEWVTYNDQVLDRLYALRLDVKGQMLALKRILKVITAFAVVILIYSVTMLFLIGLESSVVMALKPMTASVLVLLQLLPLPIAAGIFFFVARRMSVEADRKIRGVGELNFMLNKVNASEVRGYVSVEEIYRRNVRQNGNFGQDF